MRKSVDYVRSLLSVKWKLFTTEPNGPEFIRRAEQLEDAALKMK